MSPSEKFRRLIISRFVGQSPGHESLLMPSDIIAFAAKAGFSVDAARDTLVEFAAERFITAGSWDWSLRRARMCNEWDDVSEMFHNSQDQNYVRLKLLPRGEELLEEIQKRKSTIGFVTA